MEEHLLEEENIFHCAT